MASEKQLLLLPPLLRPPPCHQVGVPQGLILGPYFGLFSFFSPLSPWWHVCIGVCTYFIRAPMCGPSGYCQADFRSWCDVSPAVYVHLRVSAHLKEVGRRRDGSQRGCNIGGCNRGVEQQIPKHAWNLAAGGCKPSKIHSKDIRPTTTTPLSLSPSPPPPTAPHHYLLPPSHGALSEGIICGGIPRSRNPGIIQKGEWKMMEYLRFYLKWLPELWVLRVWICDRMSKRKKK